MSKSAEQLRVEHALKEYRAAPGFSRLRALYSASQSYPAGVKDAFNNQNSLSNPYYQDNPLYHIIGTSEDRKPELLNWALANGAQVNRVHIVGRSSLPSEYIILHEMAERNDITSAKILIPHLIKTNKTDIDVPNRALGKRPQSHEDKSIAFSTPLHRACANGFTEMAELFITHGADITKQDGDGNTPLHLTINAAMQETKLPYPPSILAYRLSAGELSDQEKEAANQRYVETTQTRLAQLPKLVQLLQEHTADSAVQNDALKTPLDLVKIHLQHLQAPASPYSFGFKLCDEATAASPHDIKINQAREAALNMIKSQLTGPMLETADTHPMQAGGRPHTPTQQEENEALRKQVASLTEENHRLRAIMQQHGISETPPAPGGPHTARNPARSNHWSNRGNGAILS